MTEKRKLRCRYQAWERGRGIQPYQCNNAAKDERELTVRAHRLNGELIEAMIELLPVCGTHRNAWDRDPRPTVHMAYQWSDTDGPYRAREREYVDAD